MASHLQIAQNQPLPFSACWFHALEPVHDLYGAALGRNRDEIESMERSWGYFPSEGQREEIARFRPNLKLGNIGQYLCVRSAALQFLPIATY